MHRIDHPLRVGYVAKEEEVMTVVGYRYRYPPRGVIMLEHAAFANIFDDTFDELPIPLHSSNLCHVTYDSTLKELDVHFVNGSTYTYFDVPRYIVRNLLLAPSAGHYFTRKIRNKFVYAKEGE